MRPIYLKESVERSIAEAIGQAVANALSSPLLLDRGGRDGADRGERRPREAWSPGLRPSSGAGPFFARRGPPHVGSCVRGVLPLAFG